MLQKHINELLQRPMDRKDFLKCVGLGLLMLVGLGGVARMFSTQKPTAKVASGGYGGLTKPNTSAKGKA